MHSTIRSLAVLFGATLVGTMLAACGSGSSGGGGQIQNYDVGASLALTGGFAIFDQPLLNGLKLGIEDVNKQPIAGKYKIVLHAQDMRSEVSQSVITTKELLDSGVKLMLVACQTDAAIAAGRLAQQAKIPVISTCATSPTLTTSVGDYMFGNYPADNFEGTSIATYARSQGIKARS